MVADLGTADGCKALVTARLAGQRDERRAPGPPLRPRHARAWLGRIQFVSSESALNIPTGMVHYGVTKSALQGLSRGLAKALAGSGVTVNTILPGPTRTDGAVQASATTGSALRVDGGTVETIA